MPVAAKPLSLRERQARQVHESVIEAVISQLEHRGADDLSMADVAQAAEISLRTLYRYFPDRASLLKAAGEHLFASLGVPVAIDGADSISSSFLAAARQLSARPTLARALVQSTAGRAARSATRPQRARSIKTALKPLTDNLDPHVARHATAVIAHLCSVAAWVAVADENGLTAADAQAAVAWAIDTLVSALKTTGRHRPRRSTGA